MDTTLKLLESIVRSDKVDCEIKKAVKEIVGCRFLKFKKWIELQIESEEWGLSCMEEGNYHYKKIEVINF